MDLIPNFFKLTPPTDKYSISVFIDCSFDITVEANLSPEGSPVNINIFSYNLDKYPIFICKLNTFSFIQDYIFFRF